MRKYVFGCCALVSLSIWGGIAFGQGDPETVAKIVDEGKNRSHAWELLRHISEDIGPRLTGSSRVLQANAWTRDTFAAFGLRNAHLFKWGEAPVGFDRGPSHVRMLKPVEQDFEFTTRSWTAGTDCPVQGPVIKQPKNMEELEAMKDKLNGAWVLATPRLRGRFGEGRRGGPGGPGGPDRGAASQPAASQPADGERRRDATSQPPSGGPDGPTSRPNRQGPPPDPEEPLIKAMYEAGILGRIVASSNELVVTGGARNWRELDFKSISKEVSITIRRSDYDSINSRLADGEEVVIEADLQHRFIEGPIPLYDVVAEIKGTQWPEQVIIVSGHLDSWDGPGSQGAQDNGVGSATTLETARILTAVGVKPKRTIRFCLWTGEEQGLLGSREYVKALSDDEKANISAVFVDDGGTDYDGGLQCIESMSPMLTKAVEPINKAFPDMQVKINVRERMPRGGASDHASFNAVGIPGFFWDEVGSGGREGKDYTFIHHTQHDTLRYAVPEYLVQSATCAAVTVYNLAMADTLLPRAPAPAATEPASPATQPSIASGGDADFTPTEGPLSGAWVASIIRNGAPTDRTFTLKFETSTDGRIRGTSESEMGGGQLSDIVFDAQSKSLTFAYRNERIGLLRYKATVNGDEMTGTMTSDEADFTMSFKAKREAKPSAPAAASSTETSSTGSSSR